MMMEIPAKIVDRIEKAKKWRISKIAF